ncbi:MAG: sulfotransferase domain-containing protein [Candidatus Marinimicrobia bacterium]|nr:sulfotransferase domain-containing protein [Candidatus Neomarinimicrobiota bacterium]
MLREAKIRAVRTLKSPLKRRNPDFIVIGAQKCGTSSLHYYLSRHPQLQRSLPKAIHYFDKWINHGYDIKWYESHFKSLFPKKKLFFESTQEYIYHREVPELIHRHYPEIKLILMLRDPVDRAYSAWNMYRTMFETGYPDFGRRKGKYPGEINPIYKYLMQGRKTFPSLREVIKIERELMETGGSDEPAILRKGLYAGQLKNYLTFFRSEQILIIGFKKFTANIPGTLEKVYRFLGVGRDVKMSFPVKNKRPYAAPIDPEDEDYLRQFYSASDHELFGMIGRELQW